MVVLPRHDKLPLNRGAQFARFFAGLNGARPVLQLPYTLEQKSASAR